MVPVQAGDILAGKYRVEDVLGRGGMGVVVSATHLQLGQRVALKFLLPNALESQDGVERFLREARAAVQIRGEHVARVTDVGTLDSGAPYIVMEYLVGSDLASVLRQHGPLPIAVVIEYVLQCCEAIAEAHALGIVHRDLKPANLFLTQRPDGSALVKVLDFGISKRLGPHTFSEDERHITATASVMGSPLYMSPEQITSSRDVDFRSDIWALGIILHELLAGQAPYTAESAPALMVSIAVAQPAPLRSHRPDAPPELEAAILRCLQKDRNQRFANVAELARALAPFAESGGALAAERVRRVLGVKPLPELEARSELGQSHPNALTETGRAETLSPWGGTGVELVSKARRNWLFAGAALALALGAAALLVTLLERDPGLDNAAPAQSSISSSASSADVPTHRAPPPEPMVSPVSEAPRPNAVPSPGQAPTLAPSGLPQSALAPRPQIPTLPKRAAEKKPRESAQAGQAKPRSPASASPPKDLFNDLD